MISVDSIILYSAVGCVMILTDRMHLAALSWSLLQLYRKAATFIVKIKTNIQGINVIMFTAVTSGTCSRMLISCVGILAHAPIQHGVK